ncbi:MAG: hypothetical protein ACREA9_05050, partial [Pyrinomonadaceae bacterium]
ESLSEPCSVNLFTDSRYVVETMGGRFRRKTNHEWWARLDKAARRIAAAGHVDEEILRAAIDRAGTTEDLVTEEVEEV